MPRTVSATKSDRFASRPRRAVTLAACLAAMTAQAVPACGPSDGASLDEILARIERDRPRYLFIGESHAVGPVKRFTVDLVNGLVDLGMDVGLYVEGFSTECPPRALDCSRLAPLFNADAFLALLDRSRAIVHPIDPPGRSGRAARMAESIAWGSEEIRVVLVGNTHVLHAGNPDAMVPIFGGGLLYPDPGDLAEAFPRQESLTFRLETTSDEIEAYALIADGEAYALIADGCDADYAIRTRPTPLY